MSNVTQIGQLMIKNNIQLAKPIADAYTAFSEKVAAAAESYKTDIGNPEINLDKAFIAFKGKVDSAWKIYNSNFKNHPRDLQSAKAIAAYVSYMEKIEVMQRAYTSFLAANTAVQDAEKNAIESVFKVARLGKSAWDADFHASYVDSCANYNTLHISASDTAIIEGAHDRAESLKEKVKQSASDINDIYSSYINKAVDAQTAYAEYIASIGSVANAFKALTEVASYSEYLWFLDFDEFEED